MMAKRLVVVVIMVVSVGLAACGDSPETKAVKTINKAQDKHGAVVMSAAGDVNGSSGPATAGVVIGRQAGELDALAADLAAVDVPSDARTLRDALVRQIRQAANLARQWRKDPAFAADIAQAQGRIRESARALNRGLGR